MKVEELMIGDWVWVNDCEHLRPMQVAAIKRKSGKFYAECVDPNDATEHCECIVDKLVGIKIDKRFLEANGFEWDDDYRLWRKVLMEGYYIIWEDDDVQIPHLRVVTPYRRASMHFAETRIHHLQHALRFCGLVNTTIVPR